MIPKELAELAKERTVMEVRSLKEVEVLLELVFVSLPDAEFETEKGSHLAILHLLSYFFVS